MRLSILSVAYALAPIGPAAVGGAEQVLTRLDAALTREGHQSLVIACEDSQPEGLLIPVPKPAGIFDNALRRAAAVRHQQAILRTLERRHVDLVHLHGVDFLDYLPPPGVPVLVTLHLPVDWYPAAALAVDRPDTFFNCVSASQHRTCPPCPKLLPPIENGVPDELFESRHAKRRFALAMGRICPEKGFHLALDAASRAGIPLLLAGEVFPYEAHQRYHELEISPRLNGSARFIGPINLERKRRLLSAARCVLVPSLAPETSSLVAMEALASGTPVVAFRSGALTDIVEHGRTGFLVSSTEEMARAIHESESIDGEECRRSALERFSLRRMVDNYLSLYGRLARNSAARMNAVKDKLCGNDQIRFLSSQTPLRESERAYQLNGSA